MASLLSPSPAPMRSVARRLTPFLGLLLAACLAVLGGLLLRKFRIVPTQSTTNQLQVVVLNVGQGEASWVRTPRGRFIVIGTGPVGQGALVAASLKEAGAKQIDLLILPYPYAEAIGGTRELTSALPVRAAVEPGGPIVNQWQTQMRAVLSQKNILVQNGRAGTIYKIDGAIIRLLAPTDPPLTATPTSANNSLVVQLEWKQTRFLWAGGIEKAGEEALMDRENTALASDWLRVARFATIEASSPEFLRLVSPTHAVVSVGANRSGYPDEKTLARLSASGAKVYRTDAQSSPLVFHSDGQSVSGPL